MRFQDPGRLFLQSLLAGEIDLNVLDHGYQDTRSWLAVWDGDPNLIEGQESGTFDLGSIGR
jgi:hypothetical protein